MKRFSIAFVVLFLLLISGCKVETSSLRITPSPTISPDLYDLSWLTGDPCYAPCWYGLEIEKSTEEQVLNVLKSLPFVDFNTLEISTTGFGNPITGENYNATSISVRKVGDTWVNLRIGKGVLKTLSFSLNYDVPLGDVVEQFGEPDAISVWPDGILEVCDINVFWLEMQLFIRYRIVDTDWPHDCDEMQNGKSVDRNQAVEVVFVFFEDWLTAMVDRGDTIPWPGFVD